MLDRLRAGQHRHPALSPSLGGHRGGVPLGRFNSIPQGKWVRKDRRQRVRVRSQEAEPLGSDLDCRRQRSADHLLDAGDLEPEWSVEGQRLQERDPRPGRDAELLQIAQSLGILIGDTTHHRRLPGARSSNRCSSDRADRAIQTRDRVAVGIDGRGRRGPRPCGPPAPRRCDAPAAPPRRGPRPSRSPGPRPGSAPAGDGGAPLRGRSVRRRLTARRPGSARAAPARARSDA